MVNHVRGPKLSRFLIKSITYSSFVRTKVDRVKLLLKQLKLSQFFNKNHYLAHRPMHISTKEKQA